VTLNSTSTGSATGRIGGRCFFLYGCDGQELPLTWPLPDGERDFLPDLPYLKNEMKESVFSDEILLQLRIKASSKNRFPGFWGRLEGVLFPLS